MSFNSIGGNFPRFPRIPDSHKPTPDGGGSFPFGNPKKPSNVPPPPPPGPLPDLGHIFPGGPQDGQPGKGISAGPLKDLFVDGSKNKLPGGLTGGIGAGPLGDIFSGGPQNGQPGNGHTGGISAGPLKGIFVDGSQNAQSGRPDTFNALEVRMKMGSLKIRA